MPKFTKKTGAKAGRKSGQAPKEKAKAKAAVEVKAEEARVEIPPAAAHSPPMPANPTERKNLLDQAAWWTAANPFDTTPPTELHEMMHEMRKSRDPVFLRRVFGNEKAEAVQDWDEGDESEFLATVVGPKVRRLG
jgi:hypothetical protein